MRIRDAAVLTAVLTLSACAPADKSGQGEPINDATAEEAGGQMASSIEGGADGFRRNSEPAPFAMVGTTGGDGGFIPQQCLSLAPGQTWTDADNDSIPAPRVQVDISCNLPNVTASGRFFLEDLTPSIPGFDAEYAYEDLDVLVTGTDGKYHIMGDASELNSAAIAGADMLALTHHEDQDTVTQGITLDDTVYGQIDETYEWDLVLTVTGFQPGNDAPSGSLEVAGDWEVRVQHFVFEELDQRSHTNVTTTTPLGLDPACPTNIVSGSVRATFEGADGQAEINVTWTGCGEHTSTFNASSS